MEIRVLGADEAQALDRVADGVFDKSVDVNLAVQFLADARHHLAVAIDDDEVVGMASAVDYIHPDKSVELWINEIGVADAYQRQGVGRQLLLSLFELARSLGCKNAWVVTEPDKSAAQLLYAAVGGRVTPSVMYSFDLSE